MSTDSKKSNLFELDRYRLRALHDANFYSTLQETKQSCLVIFTSTGCASCRAWKEILLEYLQLHDSLTMFEVDAHESMALVSEYEVFHLPALFLFKDGAFHSPLQCEANIEKLHNAINTALSKPAQEEP
ncbi:MAG: thioredoxin family protein [Gammaproteobacteria bacterium]|nr:thioredoxin family protein [Gammaproteobacteria bacterium]